METIEDIVREMRALGRLDEKSTDKIPRSLQALGLRTYADRIEAAHEFWSAVDKARAAGEGYAAGKQSATCKDSLPVGNAAKMREALQKIVLLTVKAGKSISCDVACGIIAGTAKCALSAPVRNCDRFNAPKEIK